MPTTYHRLDPLDHLDASLQDFEPTTPPKATFGYPSHHSGFRSDGTESDMPDPADSPGGYSPPAWRRLENGLRDSGFWRRTDRVLDAVPDRPSRESSPGHDLDDAGGDDVDDVLDKAIRTRLPTGSMSPEKMRSPSPAPKADPGSLVGQDSLPGVGAAHEAPDNCT